MTKFSGYIQIPLDQSLDYRDIKRQTKLVGDWATKSRQILKKPRKFIVTAHVFNTEGQKAVTTINYQSSGGHNTVAQAATLAFDEARNGTANIDMGKSYVVIRV